MVNQKVGDTGGLNISGCFLEEATIANIGLFQAVPGKDMSDVVISGCAVSNVAASGGKLLSIGTGTAGPGHTKWLTNIQLTGITDSSYRNFTGSVFDILDGDGIEISADLLDNHGTAGPTIFNVPTGGAINVHLGSNNVPSGSYPTGYYSATNTVPMQSGPWLAYTPTPGCGATPGSVVFASPSGRWNSDGKTYWFRASFTITTNDTCSVVNTLTLPFTAQTACDIVGKETAVSGKMLEGHITSGSNIISITDYSNAYIGANGAAFSLSGTCESQ